MTPSASVIVCAYDEDRWPLLEGAIRSLEAQLHPPAEIVLVVDANPRLHERAEAWFEHVRVVANTHRQGLAGARNTGVATASGDIVAFLDDDAYAAPDWLARLLEPYADPAVAGSGGSIEPAWPTARPAWFPQEFDWVVGCTYRGLPQANGDVRNLIGCNMSFRRSLLERLGPFRVEYGCDETELCIRLRQRWPTLRLRYVPEARVLHHVSKDRTRFGYFVSRCYFEGRKKALVSSLVGAEDALSSERRYVSRVLPAGLRRGLADFMVRADSGGLHRSAAIMAGLAATAAGYSVAALVPGQTGQRLPRGD